MANNPSDTNVGRLTDKIDDLAAVLHAHQLADATMHAEIAGRLGRVEDKLDGLTRAAERRSERRWELVVAAVGAALAAIMGIVAAFRPH